MTYEQYVRKRIAELQEQIKVVVADRNVKAHIEDHHGVRDAAVDIETKLARIDELERALKRDLQ